MDSPETKEEETEEASWVQVSLLFDDIIENVIEKQKRREAAMEELRRALEAVE